MMITTFIPASSKLSRLIRPRDAQNRVCVVSHRLSIMIFYNHEYDDDDDDDYEGDLGKG